jgi:hypothetical protein
MTITDIRRAVFIFRAKYQREPDAVVVHPRDFYDVANAATPNEIFYYENGFTVCGLRLRKDPDTPVGDIDLIVRVKP